MAVVVVAGRPSQAKSSFLYIFFPSAPLGAAFKVKLKFKLLWKCASAADPRYRFTQNVT